MTQSRKRKDRFSQRMKMSGGRRGKTMGNRVAKSVGKVRRMGWNYVKRAVITVEASYIIPWTVILLALLITMTFFVHNRNWYKAAACETALSGNRYVEGSGGTGSAGYAGTARSNNATGSKYAEATMKQRIQEQAMPGSEPQSKVTCTQDATEAEFSGQDFPMFSEYFSWSVKEKVKKIRPVKVVRGKWILSSALEGTGNSE